MRSKKAILNILSNLVLQIVVILYGFVLPKIIIENYGSNVNGLVSSITQFLAYIALLDSGFTVVIKSELYKPIADENTKKIDLILKSADKFFKRMAYIFIVYIIILAFLYPLLFEDSFGYWSTFGLIIIISISNLAEYYFGMVYKIYLQAEQKGYIIAIIQIIMYILTIIITLILSKLNISIHILKLVTSVIFLIRPFLTAYYVKRQYNVNFKNVNNNYKIKNKWDGLAQHVASVIHGNTDITVLTIFCTLAEVSVYSVYYMVIKGIKSLTLSFSNSLDASWGNMIANKEYENLNKKFNMYETLYFSIITVIFTCTYFLITPFVSIYTKGITDVNYIRYLFGFLLVISEYIWAIRLPYSSVTLAAGDFKETRVGAWIECISNIILSIILVIHYGLIGVTIGTIIAMLVRTVEFIYHTNKYILKRSNIISIKKMLVLILETLLIINISNRLPLLDDINYLNWMINAFFVCLISCFTVFIFDILFYKKELSNFKKIAIGLLRRKNV